MATYTDNYSLKKPEGTDFYSVQDFNDNMDDIDEELAKRVDFSEAQLLTDNQKAQARNNIGAAASSHSHTKNNVGLDNVDNVRQYSASNPPPYPVTSINGRTGAIIVQELTNSLTEEAEIADNDAIPYHDTSEAAQRKTTWSNIKTKLKEHFDTLYAIATHSHAQSDVSGLSTTLSNKLDKNNPEGTGKFNMNSTVTGTNGFAAGFQSWAFGNYSVAMGWQAEAKSAYQAVFGIGNAPDNDGKYIFIVGTGGLSKINALSLTKNTGNLKLLGELYVKCNNDGTGGTKIAPIPELTVAPEGTYVPECEIDFEGNTIIGWGRKRNITSGTAALTPGTSPLTSGDVYLQYE